MTKIHASGGRAEVGLLWMIFSFLILLAVGFLAYDASTRVQPATDQRKALEQKSADQLAQLEYYTALVHHAATILPSTSWSGARRNPSAGDIAGFVKELDRDSAEIQGASEPVARLMDGLRKSAGQLDTDYDRAILAVEQGGEEEAEEGAPKPKKSEEWKALDQMKDMRPLMGFAPDVSLSEFDMMSKSEQDALDATAKTAAQSAPYAVSPISALVRGMAAEYKRLYDENQRLQTDLFQPSAGRVAQLLSDRETFEDTFTNASTGITKATSDVIAVDQTSAFQVSLKTIRDAKSKLDTALTQSIESTSEVYTEMGGPYLTASQSLRDAEATLAKYDRRAKEIEAKLGEIVEDDQVAIPAIDGRVIQVAPLRGSAYIDLNAYHHIDLGMRFEVFGISPQDRARGALDARRIPLGALQVTEVGRKGATSTASITRIDADTRAAWDLWEGAILVNLRFHPDYAPKVALLGIFRGFLSREGLADHLRAHNYAVQDAPGYDTDFVVRGDGGMPSEPMIDGLPMSNLGIRSVPMRRMLRMLGLRIQS